MFLIFKVPENMYANPNKELNISCFTKHYMVKIKWRCKSCGQTLFSNTKESHKMDWCKCGKSGVDAEEFYIRICGDAELISKMESNGYRIIRIFTENSTLTEKEALDLGRELSKKAMRNYEK